MLDIDIDTQERRTDVTLSGVLSDRTAGHLRDDLLKCSASGPDVLVVDVDDLDIAGVHLLSVFNVVARRLAQWPGTALVLVCTQPELQGVLTHGAITKPVRVVDDLDEVDDAFRPPERRRARLRLPWATDAPRAARRFVFETCLRWGAAGCAELATMIVSELVENVLLHTISEPGIRLESRGGVLTVAVSDDSPRPPVLREAPREVGLGLHIVSELAMAWGSTPTPSGGKVVWAALAEAALPSRN